MHRLPLILCVLALLGSGLSASLYLRIGDSKRRLEEAKRTLEARLADESARVGRLEQDLSARQEQNGVLRAEAAARDVELQVARTRLAAAEQRSTDLEKQVADVRNVLGVYELTAKALADEVASLREDLSDARHSQASPEAVEGYRMTIAELERQLANARQGATATLGSGSATAVFSSRPGRATVLNVGPENAFVVVNFGSARGAQVGHRMRVTQGSEEVALVTLSDVRTNFSIAQVDPASLRGVLHKGDSAVLVR